MIRGNGITPRERRWKRLKIAGLAVLLILSEGRLPYWRGELVDLVNVREQE